MATPRGGARIIRPSSPRPRRKPPLVGTFMVGFLATVAAFSLVTSYYDVLVPAVSGTPRFEALRTLTGWLGPGYLFLHIFLHNLGLAAIVPGIGLLAATFEPKRRNRRLIAAILATSVAVSLLVAADLVFRRAGSLVALIGPMLLVEAASVLLLTWIGVRVLEDYVPTPRAEWSWVAPARTLLPYVAIAATGLAFGALVETLFLTRYAGW